MSVKETITRAAVGLLGSFAWVAASVTLSGINTAVQLASSCVGFLIGIVTLVSMLKKLRQKPADATTAAPIAPSK